ncbi:MAG: hypothetical protein ISS88_01295 [Candidatus Portnoybacteria bacterium]|nr:hypothetical protein [Candidatus Portnoybacteria bacterium]
MKKKNLRKILWFFGLLSSVMVFGGVIVAFIGKGIIFIIIGSVIMAGVFVVNYLFSHRPAPLYLGKQWREPKKKI